MPLKRVISFHTLDHTGGSGCLVILIAHVRVVVGTNPGLPDFVLPLNGS